VKVTATDGLQVPLRGVRHVAAHPSTWPLMVLPTLITTTLFVLGLALAWWSVPALMGLIWAPGPGHAPLIHVLYAFVANLLRALAFLGIGITLYLTAGLLAVPFNDRLSAHVEEVVRGAEVSDPFDWRDIPISVAHSALALGMWLPVMVALWSLELVPGLGSLLHLVLSTAATSLYLGRELMDGAMSRRRWSFREKLDFVWRHKQPALAMGLVASVLLAIPLLNGLVLPVLIAGGTQLFLRLEDEDATHGDGEATG